MPIRDVSVGHLADAGALIAPVARNVLADIYSMKGALGSSASLVDFAELEDNAMALLTRIEKLIVEGKVRPRTAIRHSVEDATIPKEDGSCASGSSPRPRTPSTGRTCSAALPRWSDFTWTRSYS